MFETRRSPKPTSNPHLARRVGAALIGLGFMAELSACGGSDTTHEPQYIECPSHPGGSVSTKLDITKVHDSVILGDKSSHHTDHNFNDTYRVEVLSVTSGGPNQVVASNASGASPVGVGVTVKDLHKEGEIRLFASKPDPGNEPPFYELSAVAVSDTVVNVTFKCD